jgi:hypothetical protein
VDVDPTIQQGEYRFQPEVQLLTCDQQIYHVKAVQDATETLDLNRTENEQFPPEKLRMTLERFYTSVVVGATEFFRHITRLRSWKEPVRTTVFCGVCWPVSLKRIEKLTCGRDISLLGLWIF